MFVVFIFLIWCFHRIAALTSIRCSRITPPIHVCVCLWYRGGGDYWYGACKEVMRVLLAGGGVLCEGSRVVQQQRRPEVGRRLGMSDPVLLVPGETTGDEPLLQHCGHHLHQPRRRLWGCHQNILTAGGKMGEGRRNKWQSCWNLSLSRFTIPTQ